MPRKTVLMGFGLTNLDGASMRPRPDAAENVNFGTATPSLSFVLQ